MAHAYSHLYRLPTTGLRFFTVYGPWGRPDMALFLFTRNILEGKPIQVFNHGNHTRDFTYVTDTVSAFIAALSADQAVGEAVNIGSDLEVSIGEVVEVITSVMGVDVDVIADEDRIRPARSEVERLWASNEKARRLLGWTPVFGGREGFRQGIDRTVAWFSDPANRASYQSERYEV